MARPLVEVEGAKQLRRAMKRAGIDAAELKPVHQSVGRTVEQAGASLAPVRTGRLRASMRSSGTKTAAIVRAGGAKVPYAGPVHWGWPARGIGANPWISEAAQRTEPQWTRFYEAEVDRILGQVAASTAGVR